MSKKKIDIKKLYIFYLSNFFFYAKLIKVLNLINKKDINMINKNIKKFKIKRIRD